MIKSVIKFLVLSMLALAVACEKEGNIPEPAPSPSPEVQTLHYKATVQAGADTRATVGDDLKYKFEEGDKVYMESDDGHLYGFLSLSFDGGIGNNVALFEGDLFVADEYTPTLTTFVKLVLVGPEDKLHHISEEGKVQELDPSDITSSSYHDKWAVSLKEAVRQFSHFTGTGLFGDTYFTLQQQSSFLVMSLSFNPETVRADTDVTANLFNHYGDASKSLLGSVSCKTTEVDGDIEATWVYAFSPGTTLSGAKLEVSVGSENVPPLSMAEATLQANTYYTFQRATYLMDYFTVEAMEVDTEITFNYATASNGIQYSLDGYQWFNYSSPILLSAVGDKVYFRGKATSYKNTGTTPLLATGDKACYVYGDIMFLMCNEKYKPRTSIPANNAFQGAFKGATWLRFSSDEHMQLKLSAMSLTDSCYENMFEGCTGLTSAPDLPATALAKACYKAMFKSTGLSAAPALSASTLAEACYYSMFEECTSLTSSPVLPAAILVKDCYRQMFKDCSSLNKVVCMARDGINTNSSTANWLQNVSAIGTFTQSISAIVGNNTSASGNTWPRSVSGIPTDWTCLNGFDPVFPDNPFEPEEDF